VIAAILIKIIIGNNLITRSREIKRSKPKFPTSFVFGIERNTIMPGLASRNLKLPTKAQAFRKEAIDSRVFVACPKTFRLITALLPDHPVLAHWLAEQALHRFNRDENFPKKQARFVDFCLDNQINLPEEIAEKFPELWKPIFSREAVDGQHLNYDDDEYVPYEEIRTLHYPKTGSFGKVTRVRCVCREKPVEFALKELFPRYDNEEFIERFWRERELMLGLEHPHTLALVGSFSSFEKIYMVISPFCDTTLETLLNTPISPFPDGIDQANWMLNSMVCLAGGLAYIHSAGCVHRDLKGDNILLKNGQVFIGDFGLAYQGRNPSHHIASKIGNRKYKAPEAGEEDKYPRRSDVFSMGAIFAEMLGFAHSIKPTDLDKFRAEEGTRQECFYENIELVYEVLTSFEGSNGIREVISVVKQMLSMSHRFRPSARTVVQEFLKNSCMPAWPTFKKYNCCNCSAAATEALRDASLASLMAKFGTLDLVGDEMGDIQFEEDEMVIDSAGPRLAKLRRSGPFTKSLFYIGEHRDDTE
jgi:serine/threonine protein kinase